MRRIAVLFLFSIAVGRIALGQTPAGTVAGVVHDSSGAIVPGVQVQAVNKATGLARTSAASEQGDYSFPSLLAGEYEIRVEAPGFEPVARSVIVEAGATTTVNLDLQAGELKESITVEAISPQLHYDSASVGGVTTRAQIEDLPLNGRSFLELAKLEPGVQPPSRASNNRMLLPVLGAPGGNNGRGTRVTVDGGSIMAVGNGGSAMGFSQEVVQEFQTSTVTFDLATGITDSGAVNVVTRSGTNDLHGTGFYFFRDHNLAAYPALKRDPVNPDPFFQRRQFGFALGGPVQRDRVFYFANWERNEQRGVVTTTLVTPDFAPLSRITTSPLFGTQFSLRLDGRISDRHSGFIRYSHDGSRAFSPSTLLGSVNAAYPSQWTHQNGWADQSLLGLTSIFGSTLVNDLRFSYFFISSNELPPGESDCAGCLGIGAPTINVPQGNLFIGNAAQSYNLGRRFHLNDYVTLQRGTHRLRFGADWEHNRGGLLQWLNEPATLTLFSPDQVRAYNASPQTSQELRIPLPASFRTLRDIVQLPLQSVAIGIGSPSVPQEGGGLVRTWNTFRLFFNDTWRLGPRLTVNYGLGWNVDRYLNYDLRKPALLAPLLGSDGLGPTRKQWKNFSPILGLAWAPSSDGNTVVRAGGGVFYDFLFAPTLDQERALFGPPGLGRQTFSGSSIPNPVTGVPGVPIGRPLDFRGVPTLFTAADLLAILPSVRAGLAQTLTYADPGVQAIQVLKQGSLWPSNVPTPSAVHANIGVQRQITRNFVVSSDFVFRHFIHVAGLNPDLNHFNSTAGPVISVCSAAQRNDPQAICSTGPIVVSQLAGRANYKGLLFRADKRFSRGFQMLASYAYSTNRGTNAGNGFDFENWFQNYGPLPTDVTHIVNVAGVAPLPFHFQAGINFSYSSAPPFSVYLGGIDFNGDGTTGDLLPGTTVNAFNRGMGRPDLEHLVAQFNQTYAGTRDSHGAPIPRLMLPARYGFGDNFHALDLRLSRSFAVHERWNISVIGEVFNLYNKANLSGYSGDLASVAFGQPTSRATQIFGSGGPRAFQLGMRVTF
jgi:Carboxypeptidase regulatory-like domain